MLTKNIPYHSQKTPLMTPSTPPPPHSNRAKSDANLGKRIAISICLEVRTVVVRGVVEIWDEGERKVRDDEQEEVMRLEELKEEGRGVLRIRGMCSGDEVLIHFEAGEVWAVWSWLMNGRGIL